MFVKVRRSFTAGAVLFLLLLFLLPSQYLNRECEALNGLSDRVLHGDRAAYNELVDRYEAMRRVAELFLDHQVMDDVTRPLALMGVYLQAADDVSLQAAAAEFRLALGCLLAIETGDLRLLL